MAAKKHTLTVSADDEYTLLGISSDEPDYKLCWLINQKARFSLIRGEDISLYDKKNEKEQLFSFFQYMDENKHIVYRLIGNRAETGYFLPELSNIDYILHIQGDITAESVKEVMTLVSSVSSIRLCVPVDLKRIKSTDRLLLW